MKAELPHTPADLARELTLLKLAGAHQTRVVCAWSPASDQLSCSDNIEDVLPFLKGRNYASEKDWLALIHPDDRAVFAELKETLIKAPQNFMLEYRLTPGNGQVTRVRHLGALQNTGRDHVLLGVIERLDEAKKQPPASINQAVHYPVQTAYPQLFVEKLEQAIDHTRQYQTAGSLLIVALNNLAMIINNYGHLNSERVVSGIMDTIRTRLSETDHIDRIGRDQFGIILNDCSAEKAETMAVMVQEVIQNFGINAPVGLLHVTSTIVSVDFPQTAKNAIDALDKAYIAIHNSQMGLYRTFEEVKGDLIQSKQHMGLANYLRRAIQEKRLTLAYQPVIESAGGTTAHYEALLRVMSEEGQISSAGPLIPIAERMGLIEVVDTMVLEMVVEELKTSRDVVLAFNVSNLTTDNPKWLARFHALLKQNPEIAGRMIVEITETAAQQDLRQTAFFVASIQSTGAQVALDDFGSGYTSFRQLKALSVDMVKIDGAFVKDLVENVDNRFFVKTLLDFTNGFGLKAVAEFVENGETAKLLMELGVEYMQGYYFGKPENIKPWANN